MSNTLGGALAQLVERLLCKQNVIGSNPIGSTKPLPFFEMGVHSSAGEHHIDIVRVASSILAGRTKPLFYREFN